LTTLHRAFTVNCVKLRIARKVLFVRGDGHRAFHAAMRRWSKTARGKDPYLCLLFDPRDLRGSASFRYVRDGGN